MFKYNLRFPGQYFDLETNLNYNYSRDLDPSTGRYVESDPIGLRAGINTFAYVSSDPQNRIDPTRLTQCDIDVARRIAVASQKDLTFPDSYVVGPIASESKGRQTVAITRPGYGTRLSDIYLEVLTDAQAADLLNTIIHEGIHYALEENDPRQKENDQKGTGYPYSEAKRRTTKQLVDRLNVERKKCDPCSN